MPSETTAATAPEAYDLNQTVGKYLDRHMMLPLLDFLAAKKAYPESELDAARLQARGGLPATAATLAVLCSWGRGAHPNGRSAGPRGTRWCSGPRHLPQRCHALCRTFPPPDPVANKHGGLCDGHL